MNITFNYRYYTNEDDYIDYQLRFDQYISKSIAYSLEEVGEVIQFAEEQQTKGHYVALYLTYESAPFFNNQLETYHLIEKEVYAAAYAFNQPLNSDNNKDNIQYHSVHHFQFQESDEQMRRKIIKIQEAITEGDTYQVNYTTRLSSKVHYPISMLYTYLTHNNNGGYTALLDTEEVKVASISPELFFQKGTFNDKANVIVSKPMKGTMPRGKTSVEDQLNYEKLMYSHKDRAENVMIVDLLRNDMSRISKTGTIEVYKLFFIETYQTVYQMTSMVTGQLEDAISLHSILTAMFPCGSITGAPKQSTMTYIKHLETSPRYIYCGTIGLLLPDDKMIFNIPIRTVEYRNNMALYGVGAGITIDSVPLNEIQEFRDKTKILEEL
ncbi:MULTISPECIES: chorismate-binding protein [Staphylococcus]|jgi:para-aminobenzoate synthetase component 1|uniref:Anthranilate synthase component I family protein n=1 Tax=Staphylococcus hominis TaxID=1290 RepID=A0A6N0I3I6_STAHO|nr:MULTISPECIES: anthranilate synthase component I family protein [Staphylococcus]AUJ51985.1 aminodeoxychorismate synthase component I [Staphylococcus hominis subsp. hominis]AYY65894.1 anthranilate synthase component I family protein [Staphylococcus hominis]EEK12106.1 chorismate binding enzyme [Staphylococcus hominis SK119]EFS19351.1 probable anthranilate/para-aminobenzoate synthase component I [Staphylococcus hominis subsp. hominis C80]EHR90915.1 chorismate binding enzyme [Staphylococcus homi